MVSKVSLMYGTVAIVTVCCSRLFLLQLTVDYIPGFAVFVQCRGSNATNNELNCRARERDVSSQTSL